MTETLFPLPDSPSPRLEWMRRHGVQVRRSLYGHARWASSRFPHLISGWATTKDEALTDFARKNNLKLWNEE